MKLLEIQFWKLAKWIMFKHYGYEDEVERDQKCAGCRASEMQDWIDSHIDLLKWYN